MELFLHYLVALVVLSAMDGIWLPSTVNRLYRKHIGHLMAEKTNWIAGILFYLMYPLGVVLIAVEPESGATVMQAAGAGALLGALAYATYDLTNQATLKNWSATVTIADIAWGTLLTATMAGVSAWLV